MADGTLSVTHTRTAPLTLSNLNETFKDVGSQQHIRFSDVKGLHTHSKHGASMTDFLAFFRNSGALQQRAELRQNGAQQVKQAIDNEFGKGMGDRVFAQLNLDGTQGVTKRDLLDMSRIAHGFRDRDIADAEKRLGVEVLSETFKTARTVLGIDLELSLEVTEDLRGKIANAVNALPGTATQDDCFTAAIGEIVKHDLLDQVSNAPKQYNGSELRTFNENMDSCFKPGGEHYGTEPSVIHEVMSTFCRRGECPGKEAFALALARYEAVNEPIGTKAQKLHDFVKDSSGGGPDGPGVHKGQVEAFMRGNVAKATEPEVGVYAVIRDYGHQTFSVKAQRVLEALRGLEKFEYRDDKLVGTPEQKLKIAQDTVAAFDRAMTELLGGTSKEDIAKVVALLPQEYCDLLATAHAAVESGMKYARTDVDGAGLTDLQLSDRAKESMHDSLDINFLSLRVLNPILIDQATAEPKLMSKVIAFTKLLQDSANGMTVDAKGKEEVLDGIKAPLNESMVKWGGAYQEFMNQARARGHVLVGG